MKAGLHIYLGLDIGKENDYSALAILERETSPILPRYVIRQLIRFPLGTPYLLMVKRVAQIAKKLRGNRVTLAVDATGAGNPVVEMLQDAGLDGFAEISITGGRLVHVDGSKYSVPKRNLVVALQVLLQAGRLLIPANMPHAAALEYELRTFTRKLSKRGHDRYEHARASEKDDLMLATALAAWNAQHGRPLFLKHVQQQIEDIKKWLI